MSKIRKVKILQFTIAATMGGRTQYVLNNWKYIDHDKFQFDFITFSQQLDFEQRLIDEGCHVYHISCYPEDDRQQFIKELDMVLDNGYDVIHIHTSFWKDTIVEERAKVKGINRIIIHSHSMGYSLSLSSDENLAAREMHYRIREKINPDMATDYWACSRGAAEWLYGDKIENSQIKIMRNAIDVKRFSYNQELRNQTREAFNVQDKFVLGHAGRFTYPKNHDFLLRVFAEVRKKISNAVLVLVGEGALRGEIERKAERLGLNDSIYYVGFVRDVNRLYQAMDVFLFPSLFEGFGLVLLEAQTSGLKCLCSEFIPQEALVTDNVCQISLNKPNKWLEQIVKWYDGYERIDKGDIICKAGFDIHTQIRRIEEEYLKGYAAGE